MTSFGIDCWSDVWRSGTISERPLWHYTSLRSLSLILSKRTLRFSRLDQFSDDTEEGLPTTETLQERRKFYLSGRTAAPLDDALDKVLEQSKETDERLRAAAAVTCWNSEPTESAYMWTKYGKNGACISSSIGRLIRALPSQKDPQKPIYIREVKYLAEDFGPIDEDEQIALAYVKRNRWQVETELRAIAVQYTAPPLVFGPQPVNGLYISIDTTELARCILVAPGTESRIRHSVERLVRSCGLTCEVRPSAFDGARLGGLRVPPAQFMPLYQPTMFGPMGRFGPNEKLLGPAKFNYVNPWIPPLPKRGR